MEVISVYFYHFLLFHLIGTGFPDFRSVEFGDPFGEFYGFPPFQIFRKAPQTSLHDSIKPMRFYAKPGMTP